MVLVVAAGLACGGDAAGPAPLATMTIVAGDNQSGPAYGTVPVPLRVVLRRADGSPFPGGSVTWHGLLNATPTPATTTSDANGEATTVATLGAPGSVVVEARTTSLPVVLTFHLTAITPCAYLGPFRLDTTVTGNLVAQDCSPYGDNTHVDFYRLDQNGAQAVGVTMHAGFDAFLILYSLSGSVVGLDDDGGGGTDADLKAIVPNGTFVVAANSALPATGSYTVTAAGRTRTVSGCEDVWLVGAVTFSDGIATTDCVDGAGYADLLLLAMYEYQTVEVMVSSTTVVPYVRLFRGWNGAEVMRSTDTSSPVSVSYQADSTGVYIMAIGTSGPPVTGAYTLTVSNFTPAPPAVPLADARAWQRPRVPLRSVLRSARRPAPAR